MASHLNPNPDPLSQSGKNRGGTLMNSCKSKTQQHTFKLITCVVLCSPAEFLFLLWGVYLCYAVHTVPSAFHEPRYMAAAIYNELLSSAIFHIIRWAKNCPVCSSVSFRKRLVTKCMLVCVARLSVTSCVPPLSAFMACCLCQKPRLI